MIYSEIHKLSSAGNDKLAGKIIWDGKSVTADPPNKVLLNNILREPVWVPDVDGLKKYTADDGEEFVKGLCHNYRSAYLRASSPKTQQTLEVKEAYDPHEPRDASGRWTSSGGGGHGDLHGKFKKAIKLAPFDTNIRRVYADYVEESGDQNKAAHLRKMADRLEFVGKLTARVVKETHVRVGPTQTEQFETNHGEVLGHSGSGEFHLGPFRFGMHFSYEEPRRSGVLPRIRFDSRPPYFHHTVSTPTGSRAFGPTQSQLDLGEAVAFNQAMSLVPESTGKLLVSIGEHKHNEGFAHLQKVADMHGFVVDSVIRPFDEYMAPHEVVFRRKTSFQEGLFESLIQESGFSGDVQGKDGHTYHYENGVRVAKTKPDGSIQLDKKLKNFLAGQPQKVKSSHVLAAKYDAESQTLRIAFQKQPGVWHKYSPVSPEEAQNFYAADSKGSWVHHNLKDKNSPTGHKKDWEKDDQVHQPSKAKVVISGGEKYEKAVVERLKSFLGEDADPQVCSSLVGAGDHATVLLKNQTDNGDGLPEISIATVHPEYQSERLLFKDKDGNLAVFNALFEIEKEFQGEGLGTKIFASQVNNCRKHGVKYIECYAGQSENSNGYYTWPRLGYDASLEHIVTKGPTDPDEAAAQKKLRRRLLETARRLFPRAKTLLDVMSTERGRKWWKEVGVGVGMKFDLSPNSRSMKVLNAYLQHLQLKGKL